MTEGRDEDEWRKRITAKLLQGPPFIVIDNVRSRLDSAALSAALTTQVWEDRVLGQSRTIALPITCVWIATANNPALSLEVARRTVPIRIDADMERPWKGRRYKHPRLRVWARQNRGQLVWSALTMIQAWMVAGKPLGKEDLGSFEAWAEVMGGILAIAGIPGFLKNLDRAYAEADRESTAWRDFCEVWFGEFQDRPLGTNLLFGLATKHRLLLDVWGGRSEQSGRTRLGIHLKKMRDRVIGNFRLLEDAPDSHNGTQRYRLELRGVRDPAVPLDTPKFSYSNAHQKSEKQSANPDSEFFAGPNAPQPPATPRNDPWDSFLEEAGDARTG